MTAKNVVSEACTKLHQHVAIIQMSILLAQDNLPHDNLTAQQALREKINCAEKFYREMHRLDRLIADLSRVAEMAQQLTKVLSSLATRSPALFLELVPKTQEVVPALAPKEINKQLIEFSAQIDHLAHYQGDITSDQAWSCLTKVQGVTDVLARQALDTLNELNSLSAAIKKLDQTMVCS